MFARRVWTKADEKNIRQLVKFARTRMRGYRIAADFYDVSETAIRCKLQRMQGRRRPRQESGQSSGAR